MVDKQNKIHNQKNNLTNKKSMQFNYGNNRLLQLAINRDSNLAPMVETVKPGKSKLN